MLDERRKTRDERMNCHPGVSLWRTIESMRLISVLAAFSAVMYFSACTDYQSEFDDAFGALDYTKETDDSSSSVVSVSSSGTSVSVSSSTTNSSAKVSSSSARPVSATSSSVKVSSSSGMALSSSRSEGISSTEILDPQCKTGNTDCFKDSRDGQTYKKVKIGNQVWMAENLKYKADYSYCYENSDENCKKYGRLYTIKNGYKASDLCPAGWHVPDSTEWEVLFKSVGGRNVAGTHLKSTTGWDESSADLGVDDFSFSALPGGIKSLGSSFRYKDQNAFFMSSTEAGDTVYVVNLLYNAKDATFKTDFDKNHSVSVRCVEGERLSSSSAKSSSSSTAPMSSYTPPSGKNYGEIEYNGQKYRTVKIGDQEWMAENLNYDVDGSSCYMNSAKNCDTYGRLYSWNAATTACPEGSHLPDSTEWAVLFKSVGTDVATHLKATSGWNANGNGDDASGFSVFPAGGGSTSGGVVNYSSLTSGAVFWTNKKISDTEALSVSIYWNDKNPEFIKGNINDRRSVRCIKGAKPASSSSVKSSSSVASSSSSSFGSSGSFTYVINNKTYTSSYVRHNGLIWMNQDLENNLWGHYFGGSGTDIYGQGRKYFTWENARKACPNGWRLPHADEINKSRFLEDSTSFDDSGALPGYFLYTKWHKVGEEGMYWTSDTTGGYAKVFSLKKNGGAGKIVSVNIGFEDTSIMLPVRCVQQSGNMFNNPRSSSLSIKLSKETFYDSTYVTVTIGDQTWMAENLLYYYNFGGNAKCYNGNNALCREYGNYFTWNSSVGDVNNACGKYQSNWVLPLEADINKLLKTVGGADKLASVGMGGTNVSEFDFVPSGHFVNSGSFKTAEDSEYASCFWLFTANAPDNVADAYCIKKDLTGSIVKLPIVEYHPIRLIRSPGCI